MAVAAPTTAKTMSATAQLGSEKNIDQLVDRGGSRTGSRDSSGALAAERNSPEFQLTASRSLMHASSSIDARAPNEIVSLRCGSINAPSLPLLPPEAAWAATS